jgi:hypothetical protein
MRTGTSFPSWTRTQWRSTAPSYSRLSRVPRTVVMPHADNTSARPTLRARDATSASAIGKAHNQSSRATPSGAICPASAAPSATASAKGTTGRFTASDRAARTRAPAQISATTWPWRLSAEEAALARGPNGSESVLVQVHVLRARAKNERRDAPCLPSSGRSGRAPGTCVSAALLWRRPQNFPLAPAPPERPPPPLKSALSIGAPGRASGARLTSPATTSSA